MSFFYHLSFSVTNFLQIAKYLATYRLLSSYFLDSNFFDQGKLFSSNKDISVKGHLFKSINMRLFTPKPNSKPKLSNQHICHNLFIIVVRLTQPVLNELSTKFKVLSKMPLSSMHNDIILNNIFTYFSFWKSMWPHTTSWDMLCLAGWIS